MPLQQFFIFNQAYLISYFHYKVPMFHVGIYCCPLILKKETYINKEESKLIFQSGPTTITVEQILIAQLCVIQGL